MKILALEFSSSLRSAAVVREGQVVGRSQEPGPSRIGPMRLIQDVLEQAAMKPSDVTCVAVGIGPGSYTGIRVAIAIAQGWELARGVPLVSVSSIECMAWQVWLEGEQGDLAVAVDGQRGQFYVECYRATPLTLERTQALSLQGAAELERLRSTGHRLFGAEGPKPVPGLHGIHPDAGMLGVLAWQRQDFVSGAELQPIYLRPPEFVKAAPPRAIPPDPAGVRHAGGRRT